MKRVDNHRLGFGLALLGLALACAGGGGSTSESLRSGTAATEAASGASDSVPGLGDLIGVRGSAAETQMRDRGYTSVGGHAESGTAVSYWRHASDGRCVSVSTSDGRYQRITPATRQQCEAAEKATRVVASPDSGGYRTVCGVFVDGKPIRYVCSVVGGDQRSQPTTLRFPDMVMVLHWLTGNRVRVELEGMVPIEGTWSESEGETDIVTPEKTWFYISNRSLAEMEVRSLSR